MIMTLMRKKLSRLGTVHHIYGTTEIEIETFFEVKQADSESYINPCCTEQNAIG
jgi:hypothetical protein